MNMTQALTLAGAGAVGTVARAFLSGVAQRALGPSWPFGTAFVNLLGCFLFGLVWSVTADHIRAPELRLAALTGFMGAFTTFSSLVFETHELASGGRSGAAIANFALQAAVGIALLMAGNAVGRVVAG